MQMSESREPTASQHSNLLGPNQKLCSLSLFSSVLAESLANPKAGCHYLDQTSTSTYEFAHRTPTDV